MTRRVWIIGAGLAGLSAARRLAAAGCSIRITDKGRRPGGRLASRQSGQTVFNHGAQFFTVRSPEFSAEVAHWLDRGWVREWTRGFQHADGHPRYVGVPSMNGLAVRLAEGLFVELGVELSSLWPDAARFDAVVLTPPVPQSLALAGQRWAELEEIEYDRCLALMVQDAVCELPPSGARQVPEGEPICWVADERSRLGLASANPRPITIHSGAQFALEYWDRPPEEAARALLAGVPVTRYSGWEYHRWRFAKPRRQYPERFFATLLVGPDGQSTPVYFAGDAFGEPRIEGAVLSGWAVANAILRAV